MYKKNLENGLYSPYDLSDASSDDWDKLDDYELHSDSSDSEWVIVVSEINDENVNLGHSSKYTISNDEKHFESEKSYLEENVILDYSEEARLVHNSENDDWDCSNNLECKYSAVVNHDDDEPIEDSWDDSNWGWEFQHGKGFTKMTYCNDCKYSHTLDWKCRTKVVLESHVAHSSSYVFDYEEGKNSDSDEMENVDWDCPNSSDSQCNLNIIRSTDDTMQTSWNDDSWNWEFIHGIGFRQMNRNIDHIKKQPDVDSEEKWDNYDSECQLSSDTHGSDQNIQECWDDDNWNWEFIYGIGFRKMAPT